MTPLPTEYPRTYSAWRSVRPRARLRAMARARALDATFLGLKGTGKLDAGLRRPRIQLFCLHHLFPDEVTPFRRMMNVLARHFRFVSWSHAVQHIVDGSAPDRPLAAFSSDDGMATNMALASVLQEFGTTGMFFLNPLTLGSTDPVLDARFCRLRLEARPASFLSFGDVEALLAAGHEVGNHTATHVVCSETPPDRLRHEILGAHSALERRFGPIRDFAWPYGQYSHFSKQGLDLLGRAGYRSAASVVRGAHAPSRHASGAAAPALLRRDQVWATDPIRHVLAFAAMNGLAAVPSPDAADGLPDEAFTTPVSGLPAYDALMLPEDLHASLTQRASARPIPTAWVGRGTV